MRRSVISSRFVSSAFSMRRIVRSLIGPSPLLKSSWVIPLASRKSLIRLQILTVISNDDTRSLYKILDGSNRAHTPGYAFLWGILMGAAVGVIGFLVGVALLIIGGINFQWKMVLMGIGMIVLGSWLYKE